MCGIVGFINKENIDINPYDFLNTLYHRGPNEQNFYSTENVFLGHTRLSIIDIENSHQPMMDNRYVLIFNGEIYNYIELKDELKKRGFLFKTNGDTEVVLNSFKYWGIDAFNKFNGMWAIAIYDKQEKKLYLSRDRFGKKPLYYFLNNKKIVFASEPKAILKYPNIQKNPNIKKVFRYISTNYRYIDIDNESYFEGIYQVPKSTVMIIDNRMTKKVVKYWQLKDFNTIKEKETVERFRELLIDSVRLRLRSDVDVGCFLSGGMDSTSIVSVAYNVLKTPIKTFSGITGEKKGVYDESEYIDEVVKGTEAVHKYIRINSYNIFEILDEMLLFHDEPICTVTWFSLYLIVKEIKKYNVPVVLNGHGGDELLAGYWDHYQYYFYDLNYPEDEIKLWHENHKRDLAEIAEYKKLILQLRKGKKEIEKFPDYSYVFNNEIKNKFNLNVELSNLNNTTLLTNRLYKELFYETLPASLRAEDRNTMAHSIESRSPFLDYRLVEFCFKLDNKLKIKNGIGKWILREAMKGILPEKVRTRMDKAGFIAPADEWFRTINKKQIEDMLNDNILKELFNIGELKKVYNRHLKGENHQMFLWQLINFYIWYKKFFR